MNNHELLLKINETNKLIIDQLFDSGKASELNNCVAFSNDFDFWVSCCGSFSSIELVKQAQSECVISIYMCAQGFYTEAFSALRRFLEHTLFSISLSVDEFKYRLWRKGMADMNWSDLMNDEDGVLSYKFFRAFAEDVDDSKSVEIRNISKQVYRECSEFVHGNYKKLTLLSDTLCFNCIAFERFVACFESVKYVLSIALFIRYRSILEDKDTLLKLEPILTEYLGMLTEVQAIYSRGDSSNE